MIHWLFVIASTAINLVGTLLFALCSFGHGLSFNIGWQVCSLLSPSCDGSIEVASVVLAFAKVFISPYQLYHLWGDINWSFGLPLLLSHYVGVIFGSFLLFSVDTPWFARSLGIILYILSIEKLFFEVDKFTEEGNGDESTTNDDETCNTSNTAVLQIDGSNSENRANSSEAKDAVAAHVDATEKEGRKEGHFEVNTKERAVTVCVVGVLSGIMNGMFGAGGPPIMWVVSHYNLGKDETRATSAVIFSFGTILRMVMVLFFQSKIDVYSMDYLILLIFLTVTGLCTLRIGNYFAKFVNQQMFRRLILGILVFGALLLSAYKFPFGVRMIISGVGFAILLLIAGVRAKYILLQQSRSAADNTTVGGIEMNINNNYTSITSPPESSGNLEQLHSMEIVELSDIDQAIGSGSSVLV